MISADNINNVSKTPQTDTTSDVAGAANVTPAYIASDVPKTSASEGTTGIDGVSVSTSVTPTQTTSVLGTPDTKDPLGYIASDVTTSATAAQTTIPATATAAETTSTGNDMDSLAEVDTSYSYLDPESEAIKGILADLKAQGIITDGMTEEELLSAVNDYMATNFSYITDATGDHWQSVDETIKLKGGDCEDLANLEASLLIAALMDRGVSRADADTRINCVVAVFPTGLVGHVWVKYTGADGTTLYLNPATGKALSELPANQMAIFTYNSTSVNIISGYDWAKLTTASYDVGPTDTTYIKTDYAALYKMQRAVRDLATVLQASINDILAAVLAWKGGTTGFEAPSGSFEGLNHMDYYNALTAFASALTTNIFQSKSSVSNLLGIISQMITLCGSQNAALNTALLAAQTKGTAYYSYIIGGVEYCNSITTSFIDYVANMLNGYELQAWDLNLEVLKVNMSTEVLNADAAVTKAQSDYDLEVQYIANNFDDIDHYLADGSYTIKLNSNLTTSTIAEADMADTGYCTRCYLDGGGRKGWYFVYMDKDTCNYVLNNCYGSISYYTPVSTVRSLRKAEASLPAYSKAITTATEARDKVKANYMSYFNISTETEYTIVMNEIKSKYLNSETKTYNSITYTYYTIKWDCAAFNYQQTYSSGNANWDQGIAGESWENALNPSIPMQVALVKGMMIIISLLYEARRDLRGLVEKELTGEDNDYKPMAINKLCAKKVDKLEKTLQGAVSNILKAMTNLNDTARNTEEYEINDVYDTKNAAIQKDSPGMCEDDDREEDILKNNNLRAGEISTLDTYVQGLDQQQLTYAQSMLATMDVDISGTSSDDIWNSLNSQVDDVLGNMGSIVQYTSSTDDDSEYQEINWDQRDLLRGQLLAAFAMRRSVLAGMQAKADMRNLVHEEMTGIGGRNARTDIASDELENEANQTLNWFDAVVDSTESVVKMKNQIRFEALEVEKNNKIIKEIEDQKNKGFWASLISWVAAACGIIGIFFWPLLIVAAVLETISSVMNAQINEDIAQTRLDAEKTYGTKQTIVMDEFDHKTPTVDLSTDDVALQLAADAENSVSAIFDSFTSSNYLHDVGTAYSVFDSAAFAKQAEEVRNYNLQALIAQAAKQATNEMRNLVHMEMTGIGGREPSNMANAGMEAARGQQAIVMNGAFTNLSDLNQTKNAQKDLALKISYLQKLYDDAKSAAGWSYVPLLGDSIGGINTTIYDLMAEQDDAGARGAGGYTTDATFTDDTINNILNNGTIDAGDSNTMVDTSLIAAARSTYTKAFIAASVEASVQKLMRDIRSLVHQEMTGIRSATGGELSDQANAVNFESAMRTLNMVSNYLQQLVQIENKIEDAKKTLDNVTDQLNVAKAGTWITAIVSGIVGAIAAITGTGEFWQVAWAAIQAAQMTMSMLWSVVAAVKSWYNYSHYSSLKNDMPDVTAILNKLRAAVQNDANSVEGSIESLEQEALDEIATMLISSVGGGAIGTNKGLASAYKNVIDKVYKQQRILNSVAQALSELRAIVHEAMTGISSASMNSTIKVLNIKQESIKAQIDSMFEALQSLTDRWNQINDAQRATELARIQAIAATVTAMIQVAIFVVQKAMEYSKQGQDVNNAQKNVDSAKANGTFTNAEGKTVKIADSEKVAKIAELKADLKVKTEAFAKFAEPYKIVLTSLKVIDIASKVVMASYEKAAMQEFDAKQKAKADAKFGGGPRTSAVIAAEGGTGDLEQMAASAEVGLGQVQLKSEALKNTVLKQAEIDAKFNDSMAAIKKDLVKNKTQTLVSEINSRLPQEITSPARTKSDLEKSLVAAGVDPSAAHKLAESPAVTKFFDNTAKEKDLTKLAASARQMTSEINNFIRTYKPVEQKQSANTSNSLARLESIMTSITGLTEQVKTAEKAMPQDSQVQTKNQKEQLEALKIRLANEKAALSKILAEKTDLTQREIPNAQAQVKAYEDEMNNENKDLFNLITDLEADLLGLEKLEKGLKGDKSDVKTKELIEKQKEKIKAEMSGAKVAYEVAKAKYELAKSSLNVLDGQVKQLEDKAKASKTEIGKIQEDIKGLNRDIVKQQAADSGNNGQGGGDKNKKDEKHFDHKLPMYKTEETKKIKEPVVK
jgi:hypothetical protein